MKGLLPFYGARARLGAEGRGLAAPPFVTWAGGSARAAERSGHGRVTTTNLRRAVRGTGEGRITGIIDFDKLLENFEQRSSKMQSSHRGLGGVSVSKSVPRTTALKRASKSRGKENVIVSSAGGIFGLP